jgi:GMP synthase-like glutamine amidotransferase
VRVRLVSVTQLAMARQVTRVGLVDCEDASKWSDHLDVWREALAGDDESSEELEWTRYRACQGELPTAEALACFDAIVVPGSHHSAVIPADGQHPPWMQATMDLIRAVVSRGHPQLFGACFGHQLLAAALGGRVDHGENFVFKAENVELQVQPWRDWVFRVSTVWHTPACIPQPSSSSRALFSMRFTCSNVTPPQLGLCGDVSSWRGLRMLESHGDSVTELPPGAVALGSSPTCQHEMFSIGDNVLSFQGHPEFSVALLKDRILPALRENKRLSRCEEMAALASFDEVQIHAQSNRQLVREFLLHGARRRRRQRL